MRSNGNSGTRLSLRDSPCSLLRITSHIENEGGSVAYAAKVRVLTITGKCAISMGVAWSPRTNTSRPRWKVRINRRYNSDMALVIRMNETHDRVRDYFLLPTAELLNCKVKKLSTANRLFSDFRRHTNLDALFDFVRTA
jgi:hypothetical protein